MSTFTSEIGMGNLPTGQDLKTAFLLPDGTIDAEFQDIAATASAFLPSQYRAFVEVDTGYVADAIFYTGTITGSYVIASPATCQVGLVQADVQTVDAGVTVNADVKKIDGSTQAAQQARVAFEGPIGIQASGSIEFLVDPVPAGIVIDFGGEFAATGGVDFTDGGTRQDAASSLVVYLSNLPAFSAVATCVQNNDSVQITGTAYVQSNLSLTLTSGGTVLLAGISGGVDPDPSGYLAAGNSGYLPVALATDSQVLGSVGLVRDVSNIVSPGPIGTDSQQVAIYSMRDGTIINNSFQDGAIDSRVAPNLDVPVSSRLAPTVAGRDLDVSAGGEAGLDWANIGGKTTSNLLSNTTISGILNGGGSTPTQLADAVWNATMSQHLTAGSTGAALNAASQASVGSGPYAINQSGGIGAGSVAATIDLTLSGTYSAWATNAARYTSNGSTGVPNLVLRAYLKSAYDAQTGTGLVATTQTNGNGDWTSSINVASGDYYLIADTGTDGFQPSMIAFRVP